MTNQQFSALCILACTALGSVWELLAAAAAFDAFPRCYGGMGSTLDNLEMLFGMSIVIFMPAIDFLDALGLQGLSWLLAGALEGALLGAVISGLVACMQPAQAAAA